MCGFSLGDSSGSYTNYIASGLCFGNQSVAGYAFVVGVGGAIFFVILGVLFVKFEAWLPGRVMIVKGASFMLMLWVLLMIFVVYGVLTFRNSFYIPPLVLTLISYVSAGLGYLVKKFAK